MTNHVHLIFRIVDNRMPQLVLGDFKRFTSKALVKAIKENNRERRREFLLQQFKKAVKNSSNVKQYQFWRHDNKLIELWSTKVIQEKINYIHQNPVEAGLVFKAENCTYSNAIGYAGENGLLDNITIFRALDQR